MLWARPEEQSGFQLMVSGALPAFDKQAGKKYVINDAAVSARGRIGDRIDDASAGGRADQSVLNKTQFGKQR